MESSTGKRSHKSCVSTGKTTVSLYVSRKLLEEARGKGINLSKLLENALIQEINRVSQTELKNRENSGGERIHKLYTQTVYTNFLEKPKKRSIGKMKVDKSVSVTIPNGNRETYISPLLPKAPLKTLLYHHTQNTRRTMETENDKFSLFHQNILGAGSSAWYERLICNQEVAGSNPARSTNLLGPHFLAFKFCRLFFFGVWVKGGDL